MLLPSGSLKDNFNLVCHTKPSGLVNKSPTILAAAITCASLVYSIISIISVFVFYLPASHVHACEWNPDAVAALRGGIERNKVTDRCTVDPGDNAQVSDRCTVYPGDNTQVSEKCTVFLGDNSQVRERCTVYPGDNAQVSVTLR